jgi:predicted Holliday junction resolvase-like endonuclease
MRFLLIFLAVVFTVPALMVGLSWLLFVSLPYLVLLGIIILLVRRNKRRSMQIAETIRSESERERELNRREFEAWRSANEASRKQMSKRERALRKFDEQSGR